MDDKGTGISPAPGLPSLGIRVPSHRRPTHPGQILLKEFLEPLGMTQRELAERIGVSYPRINEIINGKRGITIDTALRLAKLFNVSVQYWLNHQQRWDVWHLIRTPAAEEIRKIKSLPEQELLIDLESN